MAEPTPEEIDNFIHRWKKSGGHERGAGQQFLLELCALLGLPQPDPPSAENAHNAYPFEHVVTRRKPDGSTPRSHFFPAMPKSRLRPLR